MKRITALLLFTQITLSAFCQQQDFSQAPQLSWKFKAKAAFIAGPVIDNDIIYIGSTDSNMYAVNMESGTVKWKYGTGGQIRSTVVLNNDRLYFMSGDGLYCLDKSGKLVAIFKTGGEKQYDVYDYFQSTPLIIADKVFIGSSDSCIYALNADNLKLIWKYKTNGIVHTTLAFGKGKVFAGSYDGNVYALNEDNGQLAWKFKSLGHDFFLKGEMQFSPTYANGMVYIGGRDYNLYAIDAEKGFCHWNRAFPGGWVCAATLSPKTDSVLFITTSDPRIIFAVDGIYGLDIWTTDLKTNSFDKCIFSQTMIYAGGANGKLFGLDRHTGKIIWTYNTEDYTANHLNYMKDDDSFRNDIEKILKTGNDYIVMSEKLGAIFSRPSISGNYMVFASMNGNLYCLKKV